MTLLPFYIAALVATSEPMTATVDCNDMTECVITAESDERVAVTPDAPRACIGDVCANCYFKADPPSALCWINSPHGGCWAGCVGLDCTGLCYRK